MSFQSNCQKGGKAQISEAKASVSVEFQRPYQHKPHRPMLGVSTTFRSIPNLTRNRAKRIIVPAVNRIVVRVLRRLKPLPGTPTARFSRTGRSHAAERTTGG